MIRATSSNLSRVVFIIKKNSCACSIWPFHQYVELIGPTT